MDVVKKQLCLLIVDDDERFRQGLVSFLSFLSTDSSITVVGEATDVQQALLAVDRLQPDLILLDLELVDSNGLSALIGLQESNYQGKILVLSGHQEDEWIFRAMQAGASGYAFKSQVAKQLGEAIETLGRSEVYLPPEVASRFFRHFRTATQAISPTRQPFHLTEREREVLHWLTQGASNRQIAQHLYVTVATVKAHLTSIFEKLKVSSRSQAIVAAVKLGLLQ